MESTLPPRVSRALLGVLVSFLKESLGQRLMGVSALPSHENFGGISGDFYRMWDNALRWAAAGTTPIPPPASAEEIPVLSTSPVRVKRTPPGRASGTKGPPGP